MPRLIDLPDGPAEPIDLAGLVAALDASPIDHRDEDAFASLGPLLGRLAANRTFLGDMAIAELEQRCAGQVRGNHYGSSVMMLATGRADWFVRANVWPAARDSMMVASGGAPFFYGVPHDHDFGFLTVGYFGPGYDSDYWDYDYAAVRGVPDEAVDLRPMGRQRLEPGRVMLYRAHRDVHSQRPPASLSVTINIMESTARQPWLDQYRFNTEAGRIAGFLNPLATTALLPLVARLGGEGGAALLAETARRHPSERVAFAALAASASAAPDLDGRIAILAQAAGSARAQVAGMALERIAMLETHRDWIERGGDRSGTAASAAPGAIAAA